ncbi:peroxidase-related enzyme [Halanaerobiaceae bacterium Z-7014]|uniref:Peroxidase-related enzyme n=1 Tax=Halonatronomonas betaini TaxID=2778430 RepID=A0A931AWG1_9FIRM|nr:peroxidase-related enzyme [Halonatronomonas betaini]MBF8437341.1 peroxidase-related enzyme [Halonatronomonas betaini]
MSFLKMINEENATGKLKEIYDKLLGGEGERLANLLKSQSLNPEILESHLKLYKSIMQGKSGLSRQEREMIAVVVAAVNNCHYCLVHHGAALQQLVDEDDKLLFKDLAKAYQKPNQPEQEKQKQLASLTLREKAILDYARKLTVSPANIIKSDIDKLNDIGLNDKDIHDITQVVSYCNYENRIAQGLGVELEER